MASFVCGTQPGWSGSRPSMTGLLMACSFSRVCSPSWCSVWVLASEARTTHLQLLRSGLPNSRIPRPVRLFCVPVVFIHCASYTDYRFFFSEDRVVASTTSFPCRWTLQSLFQLRLPATTDRFFNGLLQQHHFGPREIDSYGSEASDDLFVSLVDHGVFVPVSSLTAPRRDRLGRLIRF